MDAQHNLNKNVQPTETQVMELGTATELTLGFKGKEIEYTRSRPGKLYHTEQITELGAATELTLGDNGWKIESRRPRLL